jgi:hypothetical protein
MEPHAARPPPGPPDAGRRSPGLVVNVPIVGPFGARQRPCGRTQPRRRRGSSEPEWQRPAGRRRLQNRRPRTHRVPLRTNCQRQSGEPGWPFGQCFAPAVRWRRGKRRQARQGHHRHSETTEMHLTHGDGPGRTPERPATDRKEAPESGRPARIRGPFEVRISARWRVTRPIRRRSD